MDLWVPQTGWIDMCVGFQEVLWDILFSSGCLYYLVLQGTVLVRVTETHHTRPTEGRLPQS